MASFLESKVWIYLSSLGALSWGWNISTCTVMTQSRCRPAWRPGLWQTSGWVSAASPHSSPISVLTSYLIIHGWITEVKCLFIYKIFTLLCDVVCCLMLFIYFYCSNKTYHLRLWIFIFFILRVNNFIEILIIQQGSTRDSIEYLCSERYIQYDIWYYNG